MLLICLPELVDGALISCGSGSSFSARLLSCNEVPPTVTAQEWVPQRPTLALGPPDLPLSNPRAQVASWEWPPQGGSDSPAALALSASISDQSGRLYMVFYFGSDSLTLQVTYPMPLTRQPGKCFY